MIYTKYRWILYTAPPVTLGTMGLLVVTLVHWWQLTALSLLVLSLISLLWRTRCVANAYRRQLDHLMNSSIHLTFEQFLKERYGSKK